MTWYFTKNGAQEGPVTTESLRAQIDSGAVAPTELAWREGLADWMPISKIPDFTRQASPEVSEVAPPLPGGPTPYTAPVSAPAPQPTYLPGQPVSSGFAVASLVCGILGFLICCIPHVSWPLIIVTLVFGHLAISKANARPDQFGGRGMARTGLVLGYIGVLLTAFSTYCWVKIARETAGKSEQELQEYVESGEWMPGLSPEMRAEMRRQMEQRKAQQQQQAPR